MTSALTLTDLQRLCSLARLTPPAHAADSKALVDQLNRFFDLAQALQAVPIPADTPPLIHPAGMVQTVDLALAEDVVVSDSARAANMQNAPAQADGLFLVPRVIE